MTGERIGPRFELEETTSPRLEPLSRPEIVEPQVGASSLALLLGGAALLGRSRLLGGDGLLGRYGGRHE